MEDSVEVLDLGEEILGSAGYRVSTAITAEDGLREFEKLLGEEKVALVWARTTGAAPTCSASRTAGRSCSTGSARR